MTALHSFDVLLVPLSTTLSLAAAKLGWFDSMEPTDASYLENWPLKCVASPPFAPLVAPVTFGNLQDMYVLFCGPFSYFLYFSLQHSEVFVCWW